MRHLSIAALAVLFAASAQAQTVTGRTSRFGPGRITEIAQAPVQPVVKAVGTATQPQDPPGVTKPGPANGKAQVVVPAANNGGTRPQVQIRDALNDGFTGLAEAIRSINPSYAIAPVVGGSAMTGGSYYIRTSAVPIVYPPVFPLAYAPVQWTAVAPVVPAPVVLGWPTSYPAWLYTGTVRVDVPPTQIRAVAAVATDDSTVAALKEEVRKLREQVRELNERLQDKK
jgi:hypothetical protein